MNRYADGLRAKPLLAPEQPAPDLAAVERLLGLTDRLELLWLGGSGALALCISLSDKVA
jgi:hypothetical protein